ncbi:hypothetical protein RHODO2019_10930 [Rhodococcus antarcticus]|uniref:Uncharacterized protein n=1 Tax=Rhodococcus antarcticus TaxID=2987751 RepID=A0ABY6NX82_9NOCA|nr:hypothetical protein [Rhodococcus antarcticus]UZJ23721.1 hypothetical protein RHODO2019_10930 [Rhodococcus antarcticus]
MGVSFAGGSDIGWQIPTLLNGWVPYGFGYVGPRFRKLSNGQVELQGLARGTTINTTLFVLPVGYRPSDRLLIPALCDPNNAARIDILNNGEVSMQGGAGIEYLTIAHTFYPDQ